MVYKFYEFNREDDFKPIKSFYLKDNLNPDVWVDENTINEDIKNSLVEIAEDYFESLELGPNVKLEDIIFTGSLCNYNWSEYSDFDLHLLFDFSKIDENTELVKKYLDSAGGHWNNEHDIELDGYEVEIYSQDINEPHISTGQYSVLHDKWIKKPTKEDFVPDEELIKKKSEKIMNDIDSCEKDFKDNMEYDVLIPKIKKVWKKIKDGRKAGLSREGEFSIENIVFKLLRRNGYIKKIMDLRSESYDKKFE